MEERLKAYLESNNISYILHKHQAVFTVNESKKSADIQKIPGLRTKSLFLKSGLNDYFLVCLPGEKRLNMKLLKKELKSKDLHFASLSELKDELNLTPGSVSVFGMINSKNTLLIIDKEVWDSKITGFHPNINTETLEIQHLSLENFVDSLKSKHLILKL